MAGGIVKAVCNAMERIAPLHLSASWDNVGLLLEAAKPLAARNVLLTIDLTPQVLAAALRPDNPRTPSVIIAYHPPIFSGLKSLTLSNPLQHSLLSCAREGISIYTPHTALDACDQGVNHWLAQGLGGGQCEALSEGGMLVTLGKPTRMEELIQNVKAHLGVQTVEVASSPSPSLVSTIALCAGSGASVLNGVIADCYLTGEMSHHEVLAAVAAGRTIMLCGHTNTERGYLPTLKRKLLEELAAQDPAEWNVEISDSDAHPLRYV